MALFLFDTELTLTGGANNQELSLALGIKTIVHWTSAASLTYVSLSLSGAIPTNGLVVCFSNVSNSSFTQSFDHESVHANVTNPAFRFRNAGLTSVNGGTGAGAVTYEYYSTLQRWIMIGKT